MFENVTYEFYSENLKRSIIPNEAEFDALKLENIQYVKSILDYIEEREENGIDSAVCLMMEKDYQTNKKLSENPSISSESVSGHSISFDLSEKNKLVELNSKSLDAEKMNCIKLFCILHIGR